MAAAQDLPVRHIFRWDLDKTYLRTEFDSVRDLIRTALQKPEEKENVPGTGALLRALTRKREDSRALVTFISGSPTQMRARLERKFTLDGIRPDAFILKPQLELLMRGKFRAIRGQVGYKLEALLRVRAESPPAPETLFGDDAEQDAFIYSLYSDLITGAISVLDLERILVEAQVYPDTATLILDRATALKVEPEVVVKRIFIHLDRKTPPGHFLVFGPRVVPIINYYQAALVLYADGVLDARGFFQVVADMIVDADYGLMEFGNSFQDLTRRGHIPRGIIDRLSQEREHAQLIEGLPPGFDEQLLTRHKALAPRQNPVAREWQGPPDYVSILRADRELRDALKEKPRRKGGLFS